MTLGKKNILHHLIAGSPQHSHILIGSLKKMHNISSNQNRIVQELNTKGTYLLMENHGPYGKSVQECEHLASCLRLKRGSLWGQLISSQ